MTTQCVALGVILGLNKLTDIKRYIIMIVVLQGAAQKAPGQTPAKIIEDLTGSGFENVRCLIRDDKCYVSIENQTFRWDIPAISTALDIIASDLAGSPEINMLVLENDIPQKLISTMSNDWRNFSTGMDHNGQLKNKISITNKTGDVTSLLKKAEVFNRAAGRKFELVIYPQLYFENTLINKYYETQINLAPSLEFSLWKGNKFTGQVILPIHNSLGYEGDHIRPGFLTISQGFRISDNLSGTVAAGNFINNAYGISLYLKLYIIKDLFCIESTNGLIGNSHFIDNKWIHGSPDTYTGSMALSWFWSRFNMELQTGCARYINEDYGVFASCTRQFNETSVGLYLQAGKYSHNGGFFFSIPFFFKRKPNRKLFRITIPEQYAFTYNAGTEYYYGQSLRTETNSVYRDRFKWDKSLQNMIINFKTITK